MAKSAKVRNDRALLSYRDSEAPLPGLQSPTHTTRRGSGRGKGRCSRFVNDVERGAGDIGDGLMVIDRKGRVSVIASLSSVLFPICWGQVWGLESSASAIGSF